ncbi:MAG: hypothetical protein IT353_21960 [Gemmatimonadaceae bacterium]|nr:hypothetical protein [Gemmatimonadaceae bacterium]
MLFQQPAAAPVADPIAVRVGGQTMSPEMARNTLEGARAKRNELRNLLERAEEKRQDLTNELSRDGAPSEARPGIEARIKEVDARISALDAELAQAEMGVVNSAAIPGATSDPPRPPRQGLPEEVFAIPIVFTIFVLFPIALAYARRIWKKTPAVATTIPREMTERLEQLTDSVESIALEVERIGEGQRFVTKVMSENARALGAGAAQPIPVPQYADAERVAARPMP